MPSSCSHCNRRPFSSLFFPLMQTTTCCQLRRRIQGNSASTHFEDLTTAGKISSDYYTQEEMLQFKKPKKKKSLRKREKLDLDALEAEAISAGLGAGDLGSRNEERRQSAIAEQEKAEADMRSEAFHAAYMKAEEASKALRQEQTLTIQDEEDENLVFGGDDEDLYKSLEKARKLELKRQDEAAASGMQVIARLAETDNEPEEIQNHVSGGIVITEMEEFVSKIHLEEGSAHSFYYFFFHIHLFFYLKGFSTFYLLMRLEP